MVFSVAMGVVAAGCSSDGVTAPKAPAPASVAAPALRRTTYATDSRLYMDTEQGTLVLDMDYRILRTSDGDWVYVDNAAELLLLEKEFRSQGDIEAGEVQIGRSWTPEGPLEPPPWCNGSWYECQVNDMGAPVVPSEGENPGPLASPHLMTAPSNTGFVKLGGSPEIVAMNSYDPLFSCRDVGTAFNDELPGYRKAQAGLASALRLTGGVHAWFPAKGIWDDVLKKPIGAPLPTLSEVKEKFRFTYGHLASYVAVEYAYALLEAKSMQMKFLVVMFNTKNCGPGDLGTKPATSGAGSSGGGGGDAPPMNVGGMYLVICKNNYHFDGDGTLLWIEEVSCRVEVKMQ